MCILPLHTKMHHYIDVFSQPQYTLHSEVNEVNVQWLFDGKTQIMSKHTSKSNGQCMCVCVPFEVLYSFGSIDDSKASKCSDHNILMPMIYYGLCHAPAHMVSGKLKCSLFDCLFDYMNLLNVKELQYSCSKDCTKQLQFQS